MTRPKAQELLERYGDWQTPAVENAKHELLAAGLGSVVTPTRKPVSERQRNRRRAMKVLSRIERLPLIVPRGSLPDVVATMDENICWRLRKSLSKVRAFLEKLEKELKHKKF